MCVTLVGINSPLTPISRCSKWRTTHSLPERYSLSLCCDLSQHVQRRKLGSLLYTLLSMCCDLTHTHTLRGRQTEPHAGYGIHLSSYVCTIINKSEIAMLQTPSSEYQTRREGAEDREWNRGPRWRGVPSWQPSVPTTRTAVTATREAFPAQPVVITQGGFSHFVLVHLNE